MNDSDEKSPITVIIICIVIFLALGIVILFFDGRMSESKDVIKDLSAEIKASNYDTSKSIDTLGKSLGIVTSGVREAHERVDRVSARCQELERKVVRLSRRVSDLSNDVGAVLEISEHAETQAVDESKTETKDKQIEPEDPMKPPKDF